jgi:hypothetical protein
MSDSTLDDIKSGKGLKPLQSGNTSKSGITTEHRSGDEMKSSRGNSGITYEIFSHHSDDNNADKKD